MRYVYIKIRIIIKTSQYTGYTLVFNKTFYTAICTEGTQGFFALEVESITLLTRSTIDEGKSYFGMHGKCPITTEVYN